MTLGDQGQETYTPRVLIIDLKGALHTLKVENELFGGSSHSSLPPRTPPPPNGAAQPQNNGMTWYILLPFTKKKKIRAKCNYRDGTVEEHVAPQHAQNDFIRDLNQNTVVPSTEEADDPYELDQQVNVWSDYNRALYHPRSVYQVDDYAHADDTLPFYDFEQGKQLASTDAFVLFFCFILARKCRADNAGSVMR